MTTHWIDSWRWADGGLASRVSLNFGMPWMYRGEGRVLMNLVQSARNTTEKQQRVADDWLEKGDLSGIEVQL